MWILCKNFGSVRLHRYVAFAQNYSCLHGATSTDVKLISGARLRCDNEENDIDVEDDDMGGYAEQQARKFKM